MFERMYESLLTLIRKFYELIFHEKMSVEVKTFFDSFSYVTIGTMIGTLFSFSFNILSGRILGPVEYGQFVLLQSIGMLLYIPMLFGVHMALIKYTADSLDMDRQRIILSSAYLIVLFFTGISLLAFWMFAAPIAGLLSISIDIYWLGLIYAVLFTFYTLTSSALLGLNKIKQYAWNQPISSFLMLATFLVLILMYHLNYLSMVFAIYVANGVTALGILVYLRQYIRIKVDMPKMKILLGFSATAMMGCVCYTIYTNVGKLMINYYMSIGDVGIYGVYYYASFSLVGLFSGVFTTIFFPTVARYGNIASIHKKLNIIMVYYILLGLPCVVVVEFVILKLFGAQYPMDPVLMFLFALTALLVTGYGMYQSLFSAEGISGARLAMINLIWITMLNLVLNILLIPRYGLYGATGATVIAFSIGVIGHYFRGKRLPKSFDTLPLTNK
jgi:O-antigen/teichoic acid export membrane protein